MDADRIKDILNLTKEVLAVIPSEVNPWQEDAEKLMELCRSLSGVCMQNLDLAPEMKKATPASRVGQMYKSVRYVYERGNSFSSGMSGELAKNVQNIAALLAESLQMQSSAESDKGSFQDNIQKLYEEYRRLSMLKKLGVWGSVASIIAIIISRS